MSCEKIIEEVKKDLKETLEAIVKGINELTAVQIGTEESKMLYSDALRIDLSKIDDECFKQINSQINELKELLNNAGVNDDILKQIEELEEKLSKAMKLHSELKMEEVLENLPFKDDVRFKFLQDIGTLEAIFKGLFGLALNIESKFEEKKKALQTPLMSKIKLTLDSVSRRTINLQTLLNRCREKYLDLSSAIQNAKMLSITSEALNIAYAISKGERIWATDFISRITGIRSIAGELYTDEVKIEGLEHYLGEEGSKQTIDILLYRYPPFEPIQIAEGEVIGRYVWFLKARNAIIYEDGHELNPIDSLTVFDPDTGKLMLVRPLQLLYLDENSCVSNHCKEILLEIKERDRVIYVKYGSRALCNEICKNIRSVHAKARKVPNVDEVIEKLQKEYEEKYIRQRIKSSEESKMYSVSNLGYVWYCQIGLGMSTDPYDLTCPFVNKCNIGKYKRGKCNNWSWSRRLFPKVFITSERDVRSRNFVYDKEYSFIKPFYIKHTYVYEEFKYVQWNMPTILMEGPAVTLELEMPIIKILPRTNIIGFELPLSLLKALISSLLDERNPSKPQVTIMHGVNKSVKVSLDKILVSKWFIYNASKKGRDAFLLLQKSQNNIIESFNKFVKQLDKDALIDFAIECVAHTLAHLFLMFISISLEIEPENLLYVYKIDAERDAIMIMVAENSAWGSLDIVNHAVQRFGSLNNMLREFINFTISMMHQHIDDIEKFVYTVTQRMPMYGLKPDIRSKIENIADILKQRFERYSKAGLIIDSVFFLNNIILSREDEDIVKELKNRGMDIDIRELRNWLIDAVSIAGMSSCIDGCIACVMLDHGCSTPLLQNIYLSRNLVLWLLKILRGDEVVKGRGSILGIAIFNQAKEEFFAVSPYIDDEGVNLLIELVKRSIKVKLVTTKANAEKYCEQLKKHRIEVYITKLPRHDKFYIIDKRIMIISSQNLAAFSSINDFAVKVLELDKAEEIESQNLKSDVVDKC